MTQAITTTNSLSRRSRRDTMWAGLLLLPGALFVLLFAIIPILVVARNSFAEVDVYGAVQGGWTLENYLALTDPVYSKTLWYSLGMAALNTIVCLIVGYIVSYYIVSQPARRQPVLLLLVIIPFWTDFLVRTFAWITLLGSGGPIVGFLDLIGLDVGTLVPSQGAVVMSLLYAFLPVAVFPIYASMRGIDPSLKEAAADLGAGWWQTQGRVFVPLSAPGILGASLLTFVPTLGVFVIPVLLGGGKELLVGNLIVTLYTEFRNQPMGAAVSMVVLVLMIISIAIVGGLLGLRRRKA
ncbi:ABC transporter permease [Microbacterium fluvii]|uniref:ABC transporter permease n=1 Tax=Microbacterium fluvii TaxID=415215 RepID=A0ABW2HLB5_9MICO|nr:ABC transporter permease [Microbacterium fluvii]MCU4673956.1 ABC transporter permease [Microbacterium fluvii]